jgi:type IV pilus assembly protein PilA
MLSKSRRRVEEENGFTLIELLVVILIIGVLAAIAVPAFLNQRAKAYDSSAKSNINAAQIAEETYATDHSGTYISDNTNTPAGPLDTIESTLNAAPYVTATANATDAMAGYTLTAISPGPDADVFTLTVLNGNVTRSCSGTGGGCVGGTSVADSGSW